MIDEIHNESSDGDGSHEDNNRITSDRKHLNCWKKCTILKL